VHIKLIFTITVIFVGLVYSSSTTFKFVEGRIDGDVVCNSQGNGKTYCCASVYDPNGWSTTTYCTMCDETKPPSNCSPREKPRFIVTPGKQLSNVLEGKGLLELQTKDNNLTMNKLKDKLDMQQLQELEQTDNDDTNDTDGLPRLKKGLESNAPTNEK
jgi:hypothetical protein